MIRHYKNSFRRAMPFALAIAGGFMAELSSCSKDTDEIQTRSGKTDCFTASIEQPEQTKTWLNGSSDDAVRKVCWIPGDSIALATDNATIYAIGAECKDTTSDNVEFLKEVPDAGLYAAFYPYQKGISFNGSSYSINLPSVQRFCKNSFATDVFPMTAFSTTKTLLFKHVCGALLLRMTGNSERITQITFTGRDSQGHALPVAGPAVVSMSDQQLPVIKCQNSNDTLLTLDCSVQGIELSETPTSFYMVLPPATYNSFTLTITTHTGKLMIKEGGNPLTIQRGRGTVTAALSFKENDPVVTFADPHFQTYMVSNFDSNGSGKIERSEALSVTTVKVCTDTIASLSGIGQLANLHYLRCAGTVNAGKASGQLTELDVTELKELNVLICSGNKLTVLPLDGMSSISWLNCSDNSINSLDMKSMTGLTYFYCSDNKLTDLDVTSSTALSICYADNNILDAIRMHHRPETELSCTNAGSPVWVRLGTDTQGEYGYYKPAIYINGIITNKIYK